MISEVKLQERDIQSLFFEFLAGRIGRGDSFAENLTLKLQNESRTRKDFSKAENTQNNGPLGHFEKEKTDGTIRGELKRVFQEFGVVRTDHLRLEKSYIDFGVWENKVVVELLGMNKFCSKTLYMMLLNSLEIPDPSFSESEDIGIEKEKTLSFILSGLRLGLRETNLNYFKVLSALSNSKNYVLPEGFRPLLDEIVNRHKALQFLADNKIFKDLYVETIISRIFYELDLLEIRKLRYKDIKNTNLLQIFKEMKGEESLDDLVHYFNYQHFYVLYGRFVELDKDEDQHLTKDEFGNHDFGALTSAALDRIWSCKIREKRALFQSQLDSNRKMNYTDFIYFYISDEDKTSERSIRYWFEVLDFDCDGWISANEIEHFYKDQGKRSQDLSYFLPELGSFYCMANDLLMPSVQGRFRLDDFIRNKVVAGHFFNVLLNTKKSISSIFLDGEMNSLQTFILSKLGLNGSISLWDLHCQYQYQVLQDSKNEED
ncbi:Protein phosphatase 2A regulatory subunit (Contains a conserved version of EF hands) [Cryptosporidium felis]|nr:Protein phosphatase 2A regulatory subunit (Contains a conserved version of EF hands) [Cryptosporidium felis]